MTAHKDLKASERSASVVSVFLPMMPSVASRSLPSFKMFKLS
jgi:hypothetical protein